MHSKDAKRGEVLVNKIVLLSGETEPNQRRILFHTRCKCEDKCCDMIIDGGSTKNLVYGHEVEDEEVETPTSISYFLGAR